MRILANENVPGKAVEALRQRGHDVAWIRTDAPGSSDREVLERAQAEGRVIFTFDKDFGELIFRQGRVSAGVLLVRLAGLSPAAKAMVVSGVIRDHAVKLGHAFTVVSPGMVRIRPRI